MGGFLDRAGEHTVSTQAAAGTGQPQAEESQQPPEAQEEGNIFSPRASEGSRAVLSL